jgi:C-terminal peptidase prc
MKRKTVSVEKQLLKMKRKLYILLILLIICAASFGLFVYLNYDYIVFKHLISRHFIYTDSLDRLFEKEIKTDVRENYASYFDNLVISIVTKHIRDESGDRYTFQYTPAGFCLQNEETRNDALLSEVKILDNQTAYLRLTNFSKYSRDFFYTQINEIKKYDYLIFDLRNNYGGDINEMVKISDAFLQKGSIVAVDKMRMLDWTYKAKKDKLLHFKTIIILQNRNTASASENLIAALRENLDNVILMGETTFGKGIGQYTIPLKRGFALKATILRWYTPNGRNIQNTGIVPDIVYDGDNIIKEALGQLESIRKASSSLSDKDS